MVFDTFLLEVSDNQLSTFATQTVHNDIDYFGLDLQTGSIESLQQILHQIILQIIRISTDDLQFVQYDLIDIQLTAATEQTDIDIQRFLYCHGGIGYCCPWNSTLQFDAISSFLLEILNDF